MRDYYYIFQSPFFILRALFLPLAKYALFISLKLRRASQAPLLGVALKYYKNDSLYRYKQFSVVQSLFSFKAKRKWRAAAYAALCARGRENGGSLFYERVTRNYYRAETRARHFSPGETRLAPTFYCVNSEWSCSSAWRRHITRRAGNLGGLFTQPFFIINKISMTAPILSTLG